MNNQPPAEIGAQLKDVDTPALLLDLDAFDRNLKRMADQVKRMGVYLRPHAKTHKSAVIGLRQIAFGAVGVCCQKVSEAEAMVNGGISDILVSNEIVGPRKLARLAALARQARVAVCIDDADNVDALSFAARNYGASVDVLVEVNVGANRCGLTPGDAVLSMARRVAAAPGLRLRGLQAYQGAAQHIRSYADRRAAIDHAVAIIGNMRDLLAKDGCTCEVIAGGGTGSFRFEGESGVYNELQAGSYIFMDADYLRNLDENGQPSVEFEPSLFVYATVMSKASQDGAVLDAGFKALGFDSGPPIFADRDDAEYLAGSDEHGTVRLGASNRPLQIGDKVRLIPGHCDPTVNLYEWYVGYRHERVEALWPIARGPGY